MVYADGFLFTDRKLAVVASVRTKGVMTPFSTRSTKRGIPGQQPKRTRTLAWYGTARWARIRRHQLLEYPLCKFCLERGRVTPAEICDHVEPHHGDVNKFWLGPFQSLCKACHDSAKRMDELHGFRPGVDADGWPSDRRHPVYGRGR